MRSQEGFDRVVGRLVPRLTSRCLLTGVGIGTVVGVDIWDRGGSRDRIID